jgi:hypothetical protein
MTIGRYKRYPGYALATALLFLGVLTIVAVTALRMTTVDVRMTHNNALRQRALANSESGRTVILQPLEEHIFNRGWPKSKGGSVEDANFSAAFPTGFYVSNRDGNDQPNNLYEANANTEDPYSRDGLDKDLGYQFDGDGNGNCCNDPVDITSDIAVYRTRVIQSPGSAIAGSSGYLGVGYGLANNGAALYLELRSLGQAALGKATTTSEYRHIIRN